MIAPLHFSECHFDTEANTINSLYNNVVNLSDFNITSEISWENSESIDVVQLGTVDQIVLYITGRLCNTICF